MDINQIFTGKNYVYKKPKTRYGLLVEAVATNSSRNMVLVINLNTGKNMSVNADTLSPMQPKKEKTHV